MGISPDIIVARVDQPLDDDIRHKISMFCNVHRGLRHRKPHPSRAVSRRR